jgi:hypothetical protein
MILRTGKPSKKLMLQHQVKEALKQSATMSEFIMKPGETKHQCPVQPGKYRKGIRNYLFGSWLQNQRPGIG